MEAPFDGPRPVARGLEKRMEAAIRRHQGRRSNVLRVSPHAREPPPWDDLQVEPTVVIVDDHAGFRARAAALLEGAGYHVVGSCADGRSALSLLSTLRPDVVVLDVQLPDIDGFRVIEQLGDDPPAVVLVSSREAADYGARVARSGAVGFISKADLSAASLAEAVAGR
jgi:CheY-like chemotaxis protein